jgi:hypothetical protein
MNVYLFLYLWLRSHVFVTQWNRIGRHSNRNVGVGGSYFRPATSIQVICRGTLSLQISSAETPG